MLTIEVELCSPNQTPIQYDPIQFTVGFGPDWAEIFRFGIGFGF